MDAILHFKYILLNEIIVDLIILADEKSTLFQVKG